MRNIHRLLIVFFTVVLCSSRHALAAKSPAYKVRGMAFSSGHDHLGYQTTASLQSLRNLKRTGTKYIHVTAILGQDHLDSTTSYEITPDSSLTFLIRRARSLGFKIILKPIVQTRQFEWRGFIQGSPAWFSNVYVPYMERMASLAQQEKVDIFTVGSELKSTIKKRAEWAKVIRKVRAIYKWKGGYITYVANHDSYFNVSFWDLLDFISISGYFRLSDHWLADSPPTLRETKDMWQERADEVLAWRRRAKLSGMRILIAEAGAMSKGGGVTYTAPWDYDANQPVDLKVQRMQYESLLSVFMPPKWSIGVVLYDWELNPQAGRGMPSLAAYTPQNKPAQQVMTKYFKRFYNATRQ